MITVLMDADHKIRAALSMISHLFHIRYFFFPAIRCLNKVLYLSPLS